MVGPLIQGFHQGLWAVRQHHLFVLLWLPRFAGNCTTGKEKNMSNKATIPANNSFSRTTYLFLAGIASIPIFIILHTYVRSIDVREDEAVAAASTACFLAAVFTGRYIARIWTAGMKSVSNSYMVALVILIIACVSWIFFHADFPLRGREAINLLLFLLPLMIMGIALGMLIKMARAISQKQLDAARAGEAHSKSELHLLQSQISPHFLFNTLNNMYGLSITQHEKLPALLLKLSELLRYSVYDATAVYVPLKDEMVYINNYIEFEKIRIGDRLMLTTEFEENIGADIKIAPMLLIVFIENAFKHSKNSAEDKIFIEITLRTWGNLILFSVKNSQSKSKEDTAMIDKNSGFGLASVNKRLDLLYTKGHELTIQNDEKYYNVMLQLKMK